MKQGLLKLTLALSTLLMGLAARAELNQLPDSGIVATFYTDENISTTSYLIPGPSGPSTSIRNGSRQMKRSSHGDCLALVHSYSENSTKKMMELAKNISVVEGLHPKEGAAELQPKVIHGTVVFELPNIWLYVTQVSVKTRDGRSFSENKKRIVGDEIAPNLTLEYIRHCEEVLN